MSIKAIAAMAENRAIGQNGDLEDFVNAAINELSNKKKD